MGIVRSESGDRQRRIQAARKIHGRAQLSAGDDESRSVAERHAGDRRHGASGQLPDTAFQRVRAALQCGDGAGAKSTRHRVGVRSA